MDGKVQSMTVAGTWFAYWCCRSGFASSAWVIAVAAGVDGTRGRSGRLGEAKDL